MSGLYCEYGGVKYKIKKKKGVYIITSRVKWEGFSNYVDILGNEHTDIYMKIVNPKELTVIYEEDVLIKYKDTYFQLFANKIFASAVIDNSYMIWTDSEQLAHEYSFEKKEQFVFIKYITRKEIEAVKIVKKPVLGFQDIEQSEEVLEGKVLDMWLEDVKKSEMDLL